MSGNIFQTYTVQQGDTPQTIAVATLGDASRWREITALNRLRFPYISDQPVDWYGPPLSTGVLGDDITDGDTTVTIPGENPAILTHGAILFLDGSDDDGHYVWTAPRIDSYDETTGVVGLLDPIAHGWALGGRYRVCPDPAEQDTVVARTGQLIALPIPPAVGGQSTIITSGELIDLYGTDAAVTPDGLLTLVGGDLLTVSGFQNAQQALRFRAQMPEGESIWHPTEGNRAYVLLGYPTIRQNIDAAALYTRAALATDPRVQALPRVAGHSDSPGTVNVDADVVLTGQNKQIRLNAILREQGR